MENLKINVIDAIMGSGKSTGMINRINYIKKQSPDEKFLIIVPYLDEIKRYNEKLKNFFPLIKDNPPKRLTLEKYLKEEKDIICTHQLFLQNSDLISSYAKNYNLVIDEALNSLISVADFPQLISSNNLNANIKIDTDNKLYLTETTPKYTFTDTDISYLINYDYLKFNPLQENLLVWNNSKIIEENSIFNCIKDYFTQNDVYRLEAKHEIENNSYYYISLFPIRTFHSFKSICIMTYLWDAQLMKYYFDFYGAEYDFFYPIPVHPITEKQENLLSINFEKSTSNKNYIDFSNENRDFIISDDKKLYLNFEKILKLKICENIHIPGYTLVESPRSIVKNKNSRISLYNFLDKNKKAKGTITLSYSFYHKYLDNNDNKILEILKDNIHKFCKDNIPKLINKNKKIIWSVFDCAKNYFKSSRGYITDKNYVPINAKATNEYKDANVLIYLVNRFINPHLYNFIKNYCPTGNGFSENLYALSELIQWIWRSAIRDNKPICIYIPSKRMLDILLSWLNNYLDGTYLYTYENIEFKENTIKQENKSTKVDISKSENVPKIKNNSTHTKNNAFQNVTKKLKDEKIFKYKCIESISKYIIDTIYETEETFHLLEEKLENLNTDYSYELIFSTIMHKEEELLLFKITSKQKFLSEQDYINSLFEILTKNI